MKLEFSKAEDVINAHNDVIEELEPLTGEYVEGDFYKAVSYLGNIFTTRLFEQEEEFDLENHIINIAYVCMKIGYKLCENQTMRIN